ncbi:hypothetical protein INT46_007162 [Mucor plumbeus]|uniref:Uncharacterized protein n=1 Tax=Mucor plumbeus TaxID=97098 RepID=A0A8H7V5F3_9FUNG|nr:hypothetical protein INT46_007162 [Mucor plumbeus]
MSLTELTNELSRSFDACLETILAEPQQREEDTEGLDAQLATLKSSFLQIEDQLRDIRLKALGSKELSITESNKLLKRDIEIKKSTIDKYVTKLENWEKELPVLKENSEKAVSLRKDGNDFDSDIVLPEASTNENVDSQIEDADANKEVESTNNAPAGGNDNDGDDDDDDDEDDDVEFEEV